MQKILFSHISIFKGTNSNNVCLNAHIKNNLMKGDYSHYKMNILLICENFLQCWCLIHTQTQLLKESYLPYPRSTTLNITGFFNEVLKIISQYNDIIHSNNNKGMKPLVKKGGLDT